MHRKLNARKTNTVSVAVWGAVCGTLLLALVIFLLPLPSYTDGVQAIDELAKYADRPYGKIQGFLYRLGLKRAPVLSQSFYECQLSLNKKEKSPEALQKITVHPQDTFIIWGNVGSDLHLFIKGLTQARDNGYLANDFKLTDPDAKVIFTGNFMQESDGKYIRSIVMKLMSENPGRVLCTFQDDLVGESCEFGHLAHLNTHYAKDAFVFSVLKPSLKPEDWTLTVYSLTGDKNGAFATKTYSFFSGKELAAQMAQVATAVSALEVEEEEEEDADEGVEETETDSSQADQGEEDTGIDDEEMDDIALEEEETPDESGPEADEEEDAESQDDPAQ